MLINTVAGVEEIGRIYWEVAVNCGATGSRLLRRVILPGSLPMVLPGMRLASNCALVVTVAVEMLAAQVGLGATIWLVWQTLRLQKLYAILVVTAMLGLGFNALLTVATARLVPWSSEHNA